MSANNIIQLVGIPGVGKDYILNCYKKEFGENYAFVNFGEELSRIVQQTAGKSIKRDWLGNVDEETIRFLTTALLMKTIQSSRPTIVNTHMVFKRNGEFVWSWDSERMINSAAYIHIIAEPKDILARRAADSSRERAIETIDKIVEHQNVSLSVTRDISRTLGAGFYFILNSDRLLMAKLGLMHWIFTTYLRAQ